MSAKPKDAAISDRRLFLLRALVEVNRAVSLYNTKYWGRAATLLGPEDYSDDAIDTKIRQAIDALVGSLMSPRRAQK